MPRALIVDDKAENLYLLATIFSANGYAVDRAGNGLEALNLARANPPDLIVSDILMPGMDGFALCREWKQDSVLRSIPFVFYTATYTDPKDERFALSLGADRFVVKPQEPDTFMNVIAEVLQQHQGGRLLHSPAAEMVESNYLREYNATLIHKLEDKLVQLERASKVKEILLGSVSHELRTPLTPVMLLVSLLIGDPDTPPSIRKDLEAIRRHIEIEKRLISDLLDYAAMHSGSLHLKMQSLSLHLLVRQSVDLWREQLRAKTLHLDLRLEAASDELLSDRERLEQVLWNVIHHAVRRSPQNGLITFRSWNPELDRIAVEVQDTGKRMDAENIAWVFSPFEREVRVGEGDEQELGLGLAVSKGIIEAHGGSIGIRSEGEGSGTILVVQLPLH